MTSFQRALLKLLGGNELWTYSSWCWHICSYGHCGAWNIECGEDLETWLSKSGEAGVVTSSLQGHVTCIPRIPRRRGGLSWHASSCSIWETPRPSLGVSHHLHKHTTYKCRSISTPRTIISWSASPGVSCCSSVSALTFLMRLAVEESCITSLLSLCVVWDRIIMKFSL